MHAVIDSKDCVEMVLEELVGRIPTMPKLCEAAANDYWLAVGFWINRLRDSSDVKRWSLRFALAIQAKWGLTLPFASECVWDVIQHAAETEEGANWS